jgi:hypothetical protein
LKHLPCRAATKNGDAADESPRRKTAQPGAPAAQTNHKAVDSPADVITAIIAAVRAGQSYEADPADLKAQWGECHRDEQLMRVHRLAIACGARAFVSRDLSRVIFRPAPRSRATPKARSRSRKGEAGNPYVPLKRRDPEPASNARR